MPAGPSTSALSLVRATNVSAPRICSAPMRAKRDCMSDGRAVSRVLLEQVPKDFCETFLAEGLERLRFEERATGIPIAADCLPIQRLQKRIQFWMTGKLP